jgi:hypothetical protein
MNAAIPENTDDCGVSALSPLDWHYARKNGFHKYN